VEGEEEAQVCKSIMIIFISIKYQWEFSDKLFHISSYIHFNSECSMWVIIISFIVIPYKVVRIFIRHV